MAETRDDAAGITIRSEHDRLDTHFGEVRDALDGEGGRAACGVLRGALEVHFGQEESLYFPTLWRLRPEFERRLKGLIAAHPAFLSQLDATIALLAQGNRGRALDCFEELQSSFATHEIKEELILRSID